MEITEKGIEKIMDIIEVSGFHIVSQGDPSVGMFDAEWEIRNNFYFDNQKELDEFKEELSKLFEGYVGDVTIETFDERLIQIETEERERYQSYPVRYLIRDGNNFKIAGSTASYSSAVGDAIHMELPHWMSEEGYHGHDTKIIRSDKPEFREILLEAAGQLESEINNEEYRLRNAKRNLALIQQELKYGV